MEFNYLVERKRMIKSLGNIDGKCKSNKACETCPLSLNQNDRNTTCANLEIDYPLEATEIVRKWANEHPRKTRKDVMLEKFPNAKLNEEGVPRECASLLGLVPETSLRRITGCQWPKDCAECWNELAE